MISLTFVAHQDDDLLFFNPDVMSDPQSGNEAWICYLTAGNIVAGPSGMPYADQRVQGLRAAWARALHVTSPSWQFELLNVGPRTLPSNVLTAANGGKVRLIYTFINGANDADNGDLYRMWHGPQFTAQPIDGRASFTRDSLTDTLRALITRPDVEFIRTQDPQGHQCGDHIDHQHAARFALTANADANGNAVKRADIYFGYVIRDFDFQDNYSGYWRDEKQAVWNAYKPFDSQVGPTAWDEVMGRQHRRAVILPGDTLPVAPL